MNTSLWSQCQRLVRRLQCRRRARLRERQRGWWATETLEARALLSSTPAMIADTNPGLGDANPASQSGKDRRGSYASEIH